MSNERLLAGNQQCNRLYRERVKDMKNLTDSAQNRLDKYLSEARTSLHTCTSVDADEVQRDIREHIETELAGLSEPVSLRHSNKTP